MYTLHNFCREVTTMRQLVKVIIYTYIADLIGATKTDRFSLFRSDTKSIRPLYSVDPLSCSYAHVISPILYLV